MHIFEGIYIITYDASCTLLFITVLLLPPLRRQPAGSASEGGGPHGPLMRCSETKQHTHFARLPAGDLAGARLRFLSPPRWISTDYYTCSHCTHVRQRPTTVTLAPTTSYASSPIRSCLRSPCYRDKKRFSIRVGGCSS